MLYIYSSQFHIHHSSSLCHRWHLNIYPFFLVKHNLETLYELYCRLKYPHTQTHHPFVLAVVWDLTWEPVGDRFKYEVAVYLLDTGDSSSKARLTNVAPQTSLQYGCPLLPART